jgi:hypothetical protein
VIKTISKRYLKLNMTSTIAKISSKPFAIELSTTTNTRRKIIIQSGTRRCIYSGSKTEKMPSLVKLTY